jgi:hypothetical protein
MYAFFIFVDFPHFLYTANPKTDRIGFLQNQSGKLAKPVGKQSVRFTNTIQTFGRFEFSTSFRLVLSVFDKIDYTGSDRFSELCQFLKPWPEEACGLSRRRCMDGSPDVKT